EGTRLGDGIGLSGFFLRSCRVAATEKEVLDALALPLGPGLGGQPLRTKGLDDGAIDPRECIDDRLPVGDELELEEGRLLDDLLGPLLVGDPRQLDDDTRVADLLDERFLHPELVDTSPDDLERAVGRIGASLGRHGAVWIGDLQGEVHTTLQVEPEAYDRATLRGAGGLHTARVIVVKRPPRGDDHQQNDHDAAFHCAEHRAPLYSRVEMWQESGPTGRETLKGRRPPRGCQQAGV